MRAAPGIRRATTDRCGGKGTESITAAQLRAKLPACSECGGAQALAEALNTMHLVRPGTGWPGITNNTTELWAVGCAGCEHTTLYAREPANLLPKHPER